MKNLMSFWSIVLIVVLSQSMRCTSRGIHSEPQPTKKIGSKEFSWLESAGSGTMMHEIYNGSHYGIIEHDGEGSAEIESEEPDHQEPGDDLEEDYLEISGSGSGSGSGRNEPDKSTHKHCKRLVDIAFLLDSSESIGPVGFRAMKAYVKKILSKLDATGCDRVGVIKFTNYTNSEILFGLRDSKTDIIARIEEMKGPARHRPSEVKESRIDVGLLMANVVLLTKMLGSRNSSDKFLVIMTDGHLTKPPRNNKEFSEGKGVRKLKKKGVKIMVFAIGGDAVIPELLKATYEERNVFPERRLDELISNIFPAKSSQMHNNIENSIDNVKIKRKGKNNFAN